MQVALTAHTKQKSAQQRAHCEATLKETQRNSEFHRFRILDLGQFRVESFFLV